jgi:prophage tail gpP-like protein
MTVGAGEFGVMSLRVGDVELTVWKEFSVNSHFLTPTDAFHFVVGDEFLTDEILDLLVPGRRCQLLLDGAPQMTGYIDRVDTMGDRHSGNVVHIGGCDVFSAIVRSEIDPRTRYPEKTPLDKLLEDTCRPFGFTRFEIDNAANIDVAANRALHSIKPARKATKHKTRRPAAKTLKQYPLQKCRPHHGETYFQFLGRLTQREGLWMWPTVDGEGIVVGKPNYDQAPAGQLRRKRGGATNNILRGGIIRDGTDQPSFIVATGRVPPKIVEHTKTMVVIDNPLTGIKNIVGNAPQRLAGTNLANSQLAAAGETGSFSEAAVQRHKELYKYTERIPTQPLQVVNTYASLVARPKYVRDDDSHTMAQLRRFAMRQMSLHLRHAFCAHYEIMGFTFDNGVIPQVDQIVDVADDRSRFSGPLWVLSRTFNKSRSGGSTTTLEMIPLNCLAF